MIIGVVKESFAGERRVALTPAAAASLMKVSADVIIEAGAGQGAAFPDQQYAKEGVKVIADREEVFRTAEVIVQVRAYGANPEAGAADLARLRSGQIVVGFAEPLAGAQRAKELAERGVVLFAMELLPRISRAQSMDALSSMASVAGYKAALWAAEALPKMFPMMMTAAGTVRPAKVFVVGAGVAGLQAIATARRLGALVEAYDVRPAVKEEVESLGAKFVELGLEAVEVEDRSGYAKAMDEQFYQRQREMMMRVVAESDVVITTAAVPGQRAPVLITEEMVKGMSAGSVIVDLAAERGGNCELTQPGQTVEVHGVTIIGPLNPAASVPYHASQMYARNITAFLQHLMKEGKLQIDMEDEITRETLVCRDGQIVHPRVREVLGLTETTERSAV